MDNVLVYYPFGGPHYLASWAPFDNENHAIVARSLRGLRTAFAAALAQYDYPPEGDPDGALGVMVARVLKVDIVGPPPGYAARWIARRRGAALAAYGQAVRGCVGIYRDLYGRLPPRLECCPCASTGHHDDFDPNCTRSECFMGVCPAEGKTWAELYTEADGDARFMAVEPGHGVPSRAAPARDDDEVYALVADIGYNGHVIQKLRADRVYDEVALFFREIEVISPSVFDDLYAASRLRMASAHAAEMAARAASDRAYRLRTANELLDLLAVPTEQRKPAT